MEVEVESGMFFWHLENAWLDYDNLLLGREGIYICNNRRTLLRGSSQDLDTWLKSPPFIGATNFGHLELVQNNPRSWGQKRSPWFLTTEPNWDDPPSGAVGHETPPVPIVQVHRLHPNRTWTPTSVQWRMLMAGRTGGLGMDEWWNTPIFMYFNIKWVVFKTIVTFRYTTSSWLIEILTMAYWMPMNALCNTTGVKKSLLNWKNGLVIVVMMNSFVSCSHRIHVWYIYLHLP